MLTELPAELSEKARRRAEKERERKRRNRARWNSTTNDRRKRHDRKPPYSEYEFVFVDGEAPKDTGYSLLGTSNGYEICKPGLTTEECFDLLLACKRENPFSIFVIFGGRYDFDEIIAMSMPDNRMARLKWYGSVTWHGYTVRQAEGKFTEISKDGVKVTVYETFGWFHCKYTKALRDYEIGTEEELTLLESEKARRSEFMWAEIEEIKEYMHLELKLGVLLMDKIRDICLAAGFNPRAWYGPSALATGILKSNGIKKHMAACPPDVNKAAQQAYAGGRFEMFRGGIIGPVYSADINSAYPCAMLSLPSLANGHWKRGCNYEAGKFAVYRIRFKHDRRFDHLTPMPLFRRLPNGTVTWPTTVENWYWAPEAELVHNDPRATFLDAWIFEPATSIKPFAFVEELYRKRLFLKSLGNPAELPFKWGLNALYGQLCRTVGWDRVHKRLPPYHQLEWAGYVTSWCRAQVYRLAIQAGDDLISIDTDSVTARRPLHVTEGSILGEWKASSAERGIFFQSGVYYLQKEHKWTIARLRGVDMRGKRPPVDPSVLLESIKTGAPVRIRPKARYVSVRQALNQSMKLQGEWVTPKDFEKLEFGGKGKRQHNQKLCHKTCSGDVHVFHPVGMLGLSEPGKPIDFERVLYESKPHALPWLGGEKPDVRLVFDLLWTDIEHVDSEDYWLAEVADSLVS